MIDHIGLPVSDLERSKAFYQAALAPLGYRLLMEFPGAVGFGIPPKPDFWIGQGPVGSSVHVAIGGTREQVDAFHKAALEAGGKDNGAPGPRPIYHPNYYGAFVHDPDGHNIEAVNHG